MPQGDSYGNSLVQTLEKRYENVGYRSGSVEIPVVEKIVYAVEKSIDYVNQGKVHKLIITVGAAINKTITARGSAGHIRSEKSPGAVEIKIGHKTGKSDAVTRFVFSKFSYHRLIHLEIIAFRKPRGYVARLV